MNLRELSQKLGLSQTTVSRALNGYPEVSETTRQRILTAAARYNNPPDTRAKSLATGRAMANGHVIPLGTQHDMVNPIFGDFIAGAAETLSPDNAQEHWDIVEGQGSLFHPSYAGVSLGLLHGSQPDAIVMCHPAARNGLLGLEDFSIPTIRAAIARNLEAGRLTNPAIQCVGVSINSTGLSAEEAAKLKAEISGDVGLPCIDPLLDGPGAIVDRLLEQAR